tara:strand:- start:1066 stop:1338 length:273 start_codon:yes stop_codon:yes gene_type:complete
MITGYKLWTPANHRPALFDTQEEAAEVARYVTANRRGRMGRGRLVEARPYQTRMPGAPWAVAVEFIGPLYECGRTRRRLRGATCVVEVTR